MSLLDGFRRALSGFATKASALASLPPGPWVYPDAKSGQSVSIATSLQVSTVLACCRVLAQGLAQVPIRLYREGADGREERIRNHWVLSLLGRRPNPWQTSYEFREMMGFHLTLAGNFFAFMSRSSDGRVLELLPLQPGQVLVEQKPDWTIDYQVTLPDGRWLRLGPEDIWHVRGPSWNGWSGLQSVQLAREAIGLSLATEEAHARLHGNGVQTSGLLSVTGAIKPEDYERLQKFLRKQIGEMNRGMPLVLDKGFTFTPMAMTGVDAQHLETRKYQVEEICRAFGVNPIMVGYSDKNATYASAEQMFIAHVVHALAPLYERVEDSIEVNLLGSEPDLCVEFFAGAMMRGASRDRAEYFARALGSGGGPAWMTQNEVREADGLDRIDDAEADRLPKPANAPQARRAQSSIAPADNPA